MKYVLVICLCLVLLFFDGVAEQQTKTELQDVITMLQEQNEELLIELQEKENEIDTLKTETDSIAMELESVRAELSAAIDSHTALSTDYLSMLDYHLIHRAEYVGVFFADGQVEVRGLPLEDASVIGVLENMLVTVHFTIQGQDGLWSLVNVLNLAENVDTLGWVKWEELREYTAQDAETLAYPVRVKAGVELYDARRDYRVTADGESVYVIGRRPSEDEIILLESGGVKYPVTRDDLIYPSVRDGEIVWD
ncbi:MAG: hypothetical protein E7458_06825 [Ruminococcaceae bacterium]|nr:hypothetical protein [Oscillospiraceae bacterium]